MLYAIMGASLLAGLSLGISTVRRGRWTLYWVVLAGIVVASVWLYLTTQGRADGWDRIAMFLFVPLFLAPVGTGMILGAIGGRLWAARSG